MSSVTAVSCNHFPNRLSVKNTKFFEQEPMCSVQKQSYKSYTRISNSFLPASYPNPSTSNSTACNYHVTEPKQALHHLLAHWMMPEPEHGEREIESGHSLEKTYWVL